MVKIVEQALIQPDHSQTPVRSLKVDTDVRQFRLINGPPATTFDEATEKELHRFAIVFREEIDAAREFYYTIQQDVPRAQQFEQHFVDHEDKPVFPQTRQSNSCGDKDIHFQDVRLSPYFNDDEQMCILLLLAHVVDADDEEDDEGYWNQDMDDDEKNKESALSQEAHKAPGFDHVITMLVRALPNGTFERVDLFTWRAKDWFKAERVPIDGPLLLV
jgi:hypothetical protein